MMQPGTIQLTIPQDGRTEIGIEALDITQIRQREINLRQITSRHIGALQHDIPQVQLNQIDS